MNLRKKDTLLHGIVYLLTVSLMVLSSYIVFSLSFTHLEEQDALHNTHMLTDAIHDDIGSLRSGASYMVLYTQLYDTDLNYKERYEQIFRDEEQLQNHGVDHLLLYDPSSEALPFAAQAVEEGDDGPSFAALEAYIMSHPELLSECQKEGSISGLIFLPDRIMVVAMNSFASGNGSEQDISVIVVSRILDLQEMSTMPEGSRFSVHVDNESIPSAVSGIPVKGQFAGSIFLDSLDNGEPAGSVQLYDIMGNPGKVLHVGTIGQAGIEKSEMIPSLALAFLFLGAVSFGAHLSVANKTTYAKFRILIDELGYVRKSGNLSSRIMITGSDEVNWIADNVNDMLESLQEKEGKYHSLFEQSNDAIMILDSVGSILEYNSRTSELLGYEQSAMYGLDATDLSPEGYFSTILYVFKETLKEGSAISDIKLKLFDGSVIDANVSSSIIDKEKGTVQAIVRDITEKKRSEEVLFSAKKEAEAASRTKSEFLANMSHELRTPLNSIIGFSDMLLLETFGELNEKQKHYLNNVSNSGKHLLNLINDILDLSKVEAGKMQLHIEDTRIADMINEVTRIASPLASKKDIVLTVNIDPQLASINVDAQKLKQVLLNLLSNAIKFTPEKGKVTIEAEIHLNNVRFAVKDTGIGISKRDQALLFKEFTQVDSAHNRKYEGTGLGLALVKRFVEMHNGKVWVESEMGKGSSFYFEIPIRSK